MAGNVALVWQGHGEGMALVKDLPGTKQVTFHYLAPDGLADAPAHIATGPAFHRGFLIGYGGTPDGTTSGSAPSSPGLTMLAVTKGLKAIQIVGSVDGGSTRLLAGFPVEGSGNSPVQLETTFASPDAKNVTFHINFVSNDGHVEKYDNLGKDFACTIDGSPSSDPNDHAPVRMSCDIPIVAR